MAVPSGTGIKERKQVRKIAAKTYKHKPTDPWKCAVCDSWVFVNIAFHAMLCKEAQKHPELKAGAQKWYDEYKQIELLEKLEAERKKAEEKAKKPKKPKKGKVKHEEDIEPEAEEFDFGDGEDSDWI